MGLGGHGCAGNWVFCPGHAYANMAGHVLSLARLTERLSVPQENLQTQSE